MEGGSFSYADCARNNARFLVPVHRACMVCSSRYIILAWHKPVLVDAGAQNGPIRIDIEEYSAASNNHSWSNLIDYFWVDQPVYVPSCYRQQPWRSQPVFFDS